MCIATVGCSNHVIQKIPDDELLNTNHDVGYIPYNSEGDNKNFIVCDSTNIASGRNRIQYASGTLKLNEEILSNFVYKEEYNSFNGFVVIRFLVNCKGETGRYRAEALNYDFSSANSPGSLLSSTINIIKDLDSWTKSTQKDITTEYSKYINLRFKDGQIQNVLL